MAAQIIGVNHQHQRIPTKRVIVQTRGKAQARQRIVQSSDRTLHLKYMGIQPIKIVQAVDRPRHNRAAGKQIRDRDVEYHNTVFRVGRIRTSGRALKPVVFRIAHSERVRGENNRCILISDDGGRRREIIDRSHVHSSG